MVEQRLGSFEASQAGAFREGTVYQAYVTSDRFVAVKTGTPLEGGRAFTVHLGALGALIGYFIDKRVQKKRAALRASFEEQPLDALLTLDKKNFEVRFDALERAELKKGKLGFLGGTKGVLVLTKIGEKPTELLLQKKETVAAAVSALTPALQGRLIKDPSF
jgi:hypothetical protein